MKTVNKRRRNSGNAGREHSTLPLGVNADLRISSSRSVRRHEAASEFFRKEHFFAAEYANAEDGWTAVTRDRIPQLVVRCTGAGA